MTAAGAGATNDDDDDDDDGGEVREICGGDHKGGLLLFLRSAVLSGARMGWRRGCREISMDPQPVETNQGPLKLLVRIMSWPLYKLQLLPVLSEDGAATKCI